MPKPSKFLLDVLRDSPLFERLFSKYGYSYLDGYAPLTKSEISECIEFAATLFIKQEVSK